MKIRTKISIFSAILVIVAVSILYLVIANIASQKFLSIEKQNQERDVARVADSIKEELKNIAASAIDYSSWDVTYDFAQGINYNYTVSDLTDDSLSNLMIDYIAVTNVSGDIVLLKSLNKTETTSEVSLKKVLSEFRQNPKILSHENANDSIDGILMLSKGPMLISSQPVLKSSGDGPVAGALIMGRMLDENNILLMDERLHLNISIIRYDDGTGVIPDDMKRAISGSVNMSTVLDSGSITGFNVFMLNPSTITGYSLMNDIYGRPAIIIKVSSPRSIYTQTKNFILYTLLVLVIVSILLYFSMLFLLNRIVINRIISLDKELEMISKSNDMSRRVQVDYSDEISSFGRTLNNALETIEKTTYENNAMLLAYPDTVLRLSSDDKLMFYLKIRNEMKGHDILILVDEKDSPLSKELLDKIRTSAKEALSKKSTMTTEYLEDSQDAKIVFEARIFPLDNHEVIIILRDVTEKKKTENEIKNRNKELEIINKMSVGRELKMIELKKKISELEGLLGKNDVNMDGDISHDN